MPDAGNMVVAAYARMSAREIEARGVISWRLDRVGNDSIEWQTQTPRTWDEIDDHRHALVRAAADADLSADELSNLLDVLLGAVEAQIGLHEPCERYGEIRVRGQHYAITRRHMPEIVCEVAVVREALDAAIADEAWACVEEYARLLAALTGEVT